MVLKLSDYQQSHTEDIVSRNNGCMPPSPSLESQFEAQGICAESAKTSVK